MLSQSFEEESPPGCSLTPNTSLFGESSRASCDVSGDLSCDQKPGIVPATPDLMENWTAEKSQVVLMDNMDNFASQKVPFQFHSSTVHNQILNF